ncbi:hypothetical protein OS493_038006, partial [Desmophyllum pertusum]
MALFRRQKVNSASEPTAEPDRLVPYLRRSDSLPRTPRTRSDSPRPSPASPASDTSYYTEAAEVPMKTQEDIKLKMIELTFHFRIFSEALSSLESTFTECEGHRSFFMLCLVWRPPTIPL